MDQIFLTSIADKITRFMQQAILHYPIQRAYLFGSYAANRAQKWSDIDLALILDLYKDDTFEDAVRLANIASTIDTRIEVHVFGVNQCKNNNALYQQVLKNGVEIVLPQTIA